MARPAPSYGLASVAAPLLGALAAWLFFAAAGFDGYYSLPVWKVAVALGLTGAASVAGLALAWLSWSRGERWRGLTLLGLALNAPLPLLMVWTGLNELGRLLLYWG